MVVLLQNLVNFMWRLHFLLSYVYASNNIEAESLRSVIANMKVLKITENFNKLIKNFPAYEVNALIFERFGHVNELEFEMYPEFKFDPRYFNCILVKNNLSIIISINGNLLVNIHEGKVITSSYVNKFLDSLLHVNNLVDLKLSSLYLTEIPKMIYDFKNLKRLNLSSNHLNNCEIDHKSLKSLEYLNISHNKGINKIHESVFNLSSLEFLEARSCSIEDIPGTINKLIELKDLKLNHNKISHFTEDISNLKKLERIYINKCELKELVINMSENPKLLFTDLKYNSNLKRLKFLIPEIPQNLMNLELKGCGSFEVEVYLCPKDSNKVIFDYKEEIRKKFKYVIKFNPSVLIDFNRAIADDADSKIFSYHLFNNRFEPNKIISIGKFNAEAAINVISKDELIAKWTRVCDGNNMEVDKCERGKQFINNLYEIQKNDYFDLDDFRPIEYNNKMISILSDLFDQLGNYDLGFSAEDILKAFDASQAEQLVYFNYLLKYNKFNSNGLRGFFNLVKEAAELLKDYTFSIFLNSEEFGRKNELKRLIERYLLYAEIEDKKEEIKNILFNELMGVIIRAAKRNNSEFNNDYISGIICNVIDRIGNAKFHRDELINFLLNDCEVRSECFEYETQGSAEIIKKFSLQGIKTLIYSFDIYQNLLSN